MPPPPGDVTVRSGASWALAAVGVGAAGRGGRVPFGVELAMGWALLWLRSRRPCWERVRGSILLFDLLLSCPLLSLLSGLLPSPGPVGVAVAAPSAFGANPAALSAASLAFFASRFFLFFRAAFDRFSSPSAAPPGVAPGTAPAD